MSDMVGDIGASPLPSGQRSAACFFVPHHRSRSDLVLNERWREFLNSVSQSRSLHLEKVVEGVVLDAGHQRAHSSSLTTAHLVESWSCLCAEEAVEEEAKLPTVHCSPSAILLYFLTRRPRPSVVKLRHRRARFKWVLKRGFGAGFGDAAQRCRGKIATCFEDGRVLR